MRWVSIITASTILFLSCQTAPIISVEDESPPEERVELEVSRKQSEKYLPELDLEPTLKLPELPEFSESFAALLPVKEFPPVSEELVEHILSQLSIRQRIGQRFISWIPGTRITEETEKYIREGNVGGIILSGRNIVDRDQVKRLTSELQSSALENSPPIGLLIGIDQEGGRVNRLELEQITRFPPPFYWGEYEDPLFIEAVAYITNKEVLQVGCNMNFAPVLDLYEIPDDSIIGDRSMGIDPRKVGEQGIYYIHGAHRAGVVPVIKHFPGHGRTTDDSHFKLPVVDIDEKALLQHDLLPFQLAIEYDIDAIMTAHILYPQLDPEFPVTLSEKIIKGLLRTRLGFKGVIISDDIKMKALMHNFTLPEILKYSIKAGVDLILEQGPLDAIELGQVVYDLYQAGEITALEIDEGVKRILRLKIKYGLISRLD